MGIDWVIISRAVCSKRKHRHASITNASTRHGATPNRRALFLDEPTVVVQLQE